MSSKVQLVLLALLFAAGVLLGHLLTAQGAAAHAAAEATADSLLGELRDQHRATVAALEDTARAAAARADSADARARSRAAGWAAADAIADSLRATTDSIDQELDQAKTQADSVPLLVAKVGSLERERDLANASRDSARATAEDAQRAYVDEMRSAAALRARIITDSTRMMRLEETIADLRRPRRWSFRIAGLEFRPCVQVQVVRVGRVGAGPTICRS